MISFMLGAIAYLAMAFAANDVFAATEIVPRRQRRAVLAVLLSGAVVQVALLMAARRGELAVVPFLRGVAALALALVPAVFWPVAARLRRGRVRVLNRRLTQRAERAEAMALAARQWLGLAEQAAHIGHWQLTVPDNRLIWSDEVYRIHGLWREHYQPRIESALAAFHPADGKRVGELLQEAVAHAGKFELSARLRRPDGEIRQVLLRGLASLDANGRVDALNGVLLDVTEPRRAALQLLPHAALREVALEDALTGLADRQQFELSLGYEFKRAVRSRKPLGLVLVDIDHFRALNAHYGKFEGDAALRAVAQAVQAVPRRTGDVVARFDGAQIAVLLPLADAAGARRVGAQILEVIRAMGLPNAGHISGLLSVSVGAAAFVGMDDLYNPLELTRRGVRALGEAKAAGGNRVQAYEAAEYLEVLTQRG
jgi:diguanylate cyclase (GGDEF)-like protein